MVVVVVVVVWFLPLLHRYGEHIALVCFNDGLVTVSSRGNRGRGRSVICYYTVVK